MMKQLDIKEIIRYSLWWGGIIGLFFLSQLRVESLLYHIESGYLKFLIDSSISYNKNEVILNFVSPIRGIILWASLFLIVAPLAHNIYQSLINRQLEIKPIYFLQTFLFFIAIFLSFKTLGISGLTEEYANTSIVMFTRSSTVSYHQRFLMPAIAHLLFFRGGIWYLVFSYLCAFIFFFSIILWFHSKKIKISYWEIFSLGTLSFVCFQIIVPGYPDVLVGTLILIAFIFELSTQAKLSLFVLSLASHEASLIIWFPLALLLFDRKGLLQFLLIVAVYIVLMFTINTSLSEVISSRDVAGTSSIEWVLRYPNRELLGIFFGFKALWAVVIGASIYLLKQKNYTYFIQIVFILATGFFMTLLGVDTSRLFGWAFMAVLLAWKILYDASGKWRVLLKTVLAINLILPTVFVQLITEPFILSGLYSTILNLFN